MSVYNKIVVAIDLSSDSQKVINAALKVTGGDPGKIHLVHVVEPIAAAYSMDAYAININELQQEALSIAADNLAEIAAKNSVSKEHQHTLLGSPAIEVRNLASELEVDAIVIGSHGHAGWKILLGSTANKVLHGACCDVLTVRVGADD